MSDLPFVLPTGMDYTFMLKILNFEPDLTGLKGNGGTKRILEDEEEPVPELPILTSKPNDDGVSLTSSFFIPLK